MAKKAKLDSYTVAANITIKFATMDIQASSLEDALEKSRKFGVTDFIDDPPERNDDDFELVGVWKRE